MALLFTLAEVQVLRIYVKFDDLKADIKASSRDNLRRSNRWVPIEQSQATFTLKKKSKSSVAVTGTQLPLTLSYTCTVHKVQGISSIPTRTIICSIKWISI